jgi:hypothetical protein
MGTGVSAIMEQYPSDIPELAARAIKLQPDLPGQQAAFREFCLLLIKLLKVADSEGRQRALEQARADVQRMGKKIPSKSEVALKFACSIVIDMVAQGWELSVSDDSIEVRFASIVTGSHDDVKQRIRQGHLLERDAQLREPSVREFIRGMEQRRLGPTGWVSIFSLMRDGQELSSKLEIGAREQEPEKQLRQLRAAVSPYLQVVGSGKVCEFTGIKLTDIWRYFRHTWVNSYKSLPGRSMTILVRDSAAPHHPIIGIAALGSSMAQQRLRDEWIGWEPSKFVDEMVKHPTTRVSTWINTSIDRLIRGLYIADLLKAGIIERRVIKKPTTEAITRLLKYSQEAAAEHRRFPNATEHKSNNNGTATKKVDWRQETKTALFRWKRAKTLALLLDIRMGLQKAGLTQPSASCLKKALSDTSGRKAIRQLVRLVKAEHIGIDMMDIIICGAIPPYNTLLGGKLVCLLLTSPEVIQFYRKRYGRQASVIASSMKGRAVVREPNLVLLATTSLYGVGSSQYNRLRVPLETIGGKTGEKIEYVKLGISEGYGSYHFSRASVDYLETLLGRAGGGRKVNSIFGEGVNPLIRKIRDGLTLIGMPADDLLKHGNPRVIYGVPLAENFRDVLLGLQAKPKYFFSLRGAEAQTEVLANYWRRRWLAGRIMNPANLKDVAQHTLSYPVKHGARVQQIKEDQAELFDERRDF